jgi:hypothetical protein
MYIFAQTNNFLLLSKLICMCKFYFNNLLNIELIHIEISETLLLYSFWILFFSYVEKLLPSANQYLPHVTQQKHITLVANKTVQDSIFVANMYCGNWI